MTLTMNNSISFVAEKMALIINVIILLVLGLILN